MNRAQSVFYCVTALLGVSQGAFAETAATPAPQQTPQAPVVVTPKTTPAAGSLEQAIKGDPSQGNLPMLIRSDSFQLDSKNRIFHYRDNVELVKGDLTITSDIMTGKYDESSQLQTMVCENNVVVTRGERLRATSERAVYDIPKDTIVMTEGPELNDKGNILDADKVTIMVKEDKSFAEGHVRVKVTKGNEQNNVMKSMSGGGAKPAPGAAAGVSGATGSTGTSGTSGATGTTGSEPSTTPTPGAEGSPSPGTEPVLPSLDLPPAAGTAAPSNPLVVPNL